MFADKDYQELLLIAKEFLKSVSSEMDPYSKIKGEVIVEEDRVILLTPSHIQYAKYGRGPGKKPPFQEILDWVKTEKIKFDNSTEEGTAWAIQNSIGKNGTKNWVPNAPSFLEESIEKHLKEYQVELGSKLTILIQDEVNSIYKQIDFRDIM